MKQEFWFFLAIKIYVAMCIIGFCIYLFLISEDLLREFYYNHLYFYFH